MMNSVYRLVWSRRLNIFIAAPENARSSGKASGLKAISAAVLAAISFSAYALPEGGVVISGAEIKPVVDNTLTIVQQSQKASISWQKFSTTAAESIVFEQPNSQSIILNRVIGNEPSSLLGKMTANGQVWLLNPNGVLFGSGATVNVGGLLATSLFISDKDFTDGKYNFTGVGGSVVNRGTITVGVSGSGGYAALLGGIVSNESVIAAKLGTVVLGGGSDMTLDFSGDKLLSARVDKGVVNALAQNKQLISADGGTVIMTAQGVNALLRTVVNNEGTVEARTLSGTKGKMSLLGGKDGGSTSVTGKLDASAIGTGDGGLIKIAGSYVKISDEATITAASSTSTSSTSIKSGQLEIAASEFTVTPIGISSSSGMSAAALNTNLSRHNVNIKTESFGSVAAGDINVNSAVSWSNNNTLAFNAARHLNLNAPISNSGATASLDLNAVNNINVNENITSTGATAALNITPGTGADDKYSLNNSAKISMPSGAIVKIAGESYKVINTLEALQAMNDNLSINYVLGSDINASSTNTMNSGAGFVPIGTITNGFNSNFDGFGHQISNLIINRPGTQFVGLFGSAGGGKKIQNVRLVDVSINGNNSVGGLLGFSRDNKINNVFVSGVISGNKSVGGLVGVLIGTVQNSSAIVTVTGISLVDAESQYLGGLIGVSAGEISNVSVSGSVTGYQDIGGLVGINRNAISNAISNAIVNNKVTGNINVGLIAGSNETEISNVYATGTVNKEIQSNNLLVGSDTGTVINSKALSAEDFKKKDSFTSLDFNNIWRIYEGNTAPLLRSFLKPVTVNADSASKTYDKNPYTAAVTGINYSLADISLDGKLTYGDTSQPLVNAGNYEIGGLWSTSYDINYGSGKLTILPKELSASVTKTPTKIYDGTTTANLVLSDLNLTGFVAGEKIVANSTNLTGFYNSKNVNEAKSVEIGLNKETFTATGAEFSNYKLVVEGSIKPATLIAKPKSVTKSYDGLAFSKPEMTYSGFVSSETEAVMVGTLTYGGTALGKKDVDSYSITAGGLTSANYAVSFERGTLTINPATLTASISASPTKSYDGTTNANIVLSNLKLTGLVGDEQIEALSKDVTGFYNSKNVSEANSVLISMDSNNFKFAGGALAANYKLSNIAGTITKNGLTIKAIDKIQTYDGITYSGGYGVTYNGFVNGESNTVLDGSLRYSSNSTPAKNVGAYQIDPEGFSSSNYAITYLPGSLIIQPRALAASIVAPNKIYDGNTNASVQLSDTKLVGVVEGDEITVRNTNLLGVYNSKNVTEANKITIALTTDNFVFGKDTLASNYQLTDSSGKILPAALTIKANSITKPYDGTDYAGGGGVTYSDFAKGEAASVLSGSVSYGGSAISAKNVGEYIISVTGLSSNNYAINFETGALKIEPKVLTASLAATPTKAYDGNANAVIELKSPLLNGSLKNEVISAKKTKISGRYNSSNVSEANQVTVALTPENFDVNEGTQLSNYVLQADNGIITPTQLTIKPNNVVKYFDGLPYSGADLNYVGFVNGETPAVLDGALLYSGSAQGATNPGRYAIIANGLRSSNYNINYLPARLSIEPDLYTLAKLGQPVNAFAGKPGPANNKYILRNSSPTNDSSLKIECKQLNNVRSGSAQCTGSVNGATNSISQSLPVAGATCKSCLPSKLSIASSDSSTN